LILFALIVVQVRQLYEKLAMVKVALSEERRISAEEYNVLQQELEEEKKRRELLEKMRQQRWKEQKSHTSFLMNVLVLGNRTTRKLPV
jgi:ubiquinone/menaquinone biosynthesis C-methylase UbiE